MNVISAQSHAAAVDRNFVPSQESLGRSLNRLSAGARIGLPDTASPVAGAVSGRFDAHSKRVQSALTDVQQSASAVQTADRFLGGLTDTLSLMSDLAEQLGDQAPDAPAAAVGNQKFQALQEQLRHALGGNASAAPTVTFDGSELFGPEDCPNPDGSSDNPASLPKFRLRGGALSSLVQQDHAGKFLLGASDATATDVLKSAVQDVADARGAVGAAGARLQLESATLQVENENLSSALTPIRDEAVGGEFTRAATSTMLMQPGAALLAQANVASQGAFQLLER